MNEEREGIFGRREIVGRDRFYKDMRYGGNVARNGASHIEIEKCALRGRGKSTSEFMPAAVGESVIIKEDEWSENDGDLAYCYDIRIPYATGKMTPIVAVAPEYLDIAAECGLGSAAQMGAGAVRIFAREVPKGKMEARVTLIKTNERGEEYLEALLEEHETRFRRVNAPRRRDGSYEIIFDTEFERMCFRYSVKYGKLKEIRDKNGFEITEEFALVESAKYLTYAAKEETLAKGFGVRVYF